MNTPTDVPLEDRRAVRLPDDEVRELARRAKAGDEVARNLLLKTHLPLVIHVAKRFYRTGHFMEMGDLIQQGCLGLLHAIKKFDPSCFSRGRAVKLSTYAMLWIAHAIRRECENRSRTIRLPVEVQRQLSQRQTQPFSKRPENMSKLRYRRLNHMPYEVVSINGWGDADSCAQVLPTEEENPERLWHEKRQEADIERLLSLLPNRERFVLEQRYLATAEIKTFDEISAAIGVCPERARQLERQALYRLRAHLRPKAPVFAAGMRWNQECVNFL